MLRVCFSVVPVWFVLFFASCAEAQTNRLADQTGTKWYPVYATALEEDIRFRIELEQRVDTGMLRALGMGEVAEEYENCMRDVQSLFFIDQKKGNEHE